MAVEVLNAGRAQGAINLEADAAEYTARTMPRDIEGMSREIRELARTRNAVILAHNYQVPEVQDVADYVGDSLGLSRQAAATDAEMIVFCGVHFMAETAVILSPTKRVLIPDLEAGCSLAATINATQLAAWKAEHPGAVVVSYVNTTAEVKALSDYCCTSGNAERVIRAIPEDKEILFLPDMFLGTYLEKVTGRAMHVWPGECHVHAGIRPADIDVARREHGDADLLVHPECGCASQCMYFKANGDIDADRTHILSTEGMVQHAQKYPNRSFVVATELGIMHRLSKEAPQGRFYAASERAICRYMKKITLDKLLTSLREDVFEVTVPQEVADQARLAIQRMIEI
jgi:quinolinate synthase